MTLSFSSIYVSMQIGKFIAHPTLYHISGTPQHTLNLVLFNFLHSIVAFDRALQLKESNHLVRVLNIEHYKKHHSVGEY